MRPETFFERDEEGQFEQTKHKSSAIDNAPVDGFRSHEIDDADRDKGRAETWDKSPRLASTPCQHNGLSIAGTDSWIRVSQELKDAKADDTTNSNINSGKQIIHFAEEEQSSSDKSKTLYIPPPWRRDRGT